MTEPHPLRCETCTIPKNLTFPKWCPKFEKWVGINYPEPDCYIIQKIGCASHSSNTSAGKVLEELEARLEELRTHPEDDCDMVRIVTLSWIRELRQECGQG